MSAAPDPIHHLNTSPWKDRFEDEVLFIGGKLRPKVRAIGLDASLPGQQTVTADVAGDQPEITLWLENDRLQLETSCSCDVRTFCPHTAALLLHLEKKGLPSSSPAFPAAPSSPAAPAAKAITHHSPLSTPDSPPSFTLHIRREPTSSRLVRLLLQALKLPDTGEWIVARPEVIYGEHRSPLAGKPSAAGQPRDAAAEMNAVLQLQQAGLTALTSHSQFRFLAALDEKQNPISPSPNLQSPGSAALWFPDPAHGTPADFWPWFRSSAVPALSAAGWSVSFDEDVGHDVFDLDPDTFDFHLEDAGPGWFHLSVGFDVDGKRLDLLPILAELLDRGAAEVSLEFPADGHVLHQLPDGRALRLPADRLRRILKQFAALLDPRRFKGGKLQLHPLDAATLSASDPARFDPPAKLQQLIHSLTAGLSTQNSKLVTPTGLQADLRSYQQEGYHWLQFLRSHELHGILADDMGLGKTLQTLTHILAEKEAGRLAGRPVLVVAPTSVVPNWLAEARKFAPALTPLVLDGPQRKKYFRSIPYADLVLTSFALLQRDIEQLRKFQYHLVILDEAQHIKNPAAKVAQAACKLDARHRLCLSGTPVENHLGELWSLMRFLMPGFLGTQEDFNRRFRNPIEKEGDLDRQQALKARIAPLILRRTKDQVAKELPPKTILVHPVELNTAQKDLYETVRATMDKRVRQAIAIKGLEGSRMLFLEALLKLRQICCEPKLLNFQNESKLEADAAGSAKLDYLADLLDTLLEEGRRVLLFSQFTSMLDLIAAHLEKRQIPYLMLTGASKNRGELVERFQTGTTPLFLISLKAGGTGLNLTAADTVIHYDPWWNPAAEAQATDRAYRIGQKNPVFVHKLICQGTVEQRIHELQQKKAELADALLADAQKATAPTPDLLANLLAPLG